MRSLRVQQRTSLPRWCLCPPFVLILDPVCAAGDVGTSCHGGIDHTGLHWVIGWADDSHNQSCASFRFAPFDQAHVLCTLDAEPIPCFRVLNPNGTPVNGAEIPNVAKVGCPSLSHLVYTLDLTAFTALIGCHGDVVQRNGDRVNA